MGKLLFVRRIKNIGYDPGSKVLTIVFNDDVRHTYLLVPFRLFQRFERAHNKNDFYADEIWGTFQFLEFKPS